MDDDSLSRRKRDHLRIVLQGMAHAGTRDNGFAAYRFEHCALPELHLAQIDLGCEFLGRRLAAPLLISSMTGGAEQAARINRHLAESAQALGIALGVGSQRVALQEGNDLGLTRELRRLAPDIALLGNLGAAQLREARGLELARRALDSLEADALIVHLNPLQEALQPDGDRDWCGVLNGLERLVAELEAPVVVKEVGAGLSARVARQLNDIGVQILDVAGLGGTSWASVEAERARTPRQRAVAEAFADWGIPTAEALRQVRGACPQAQLIASGGIRNGLEAALAIRLGADLVGQAAAVLAAACDSAEAVHEHFATLIEQLRVACFCTGSANLAALRQAALLEPGA